MHVVGFSLSQLIASKKLSIICTSKRENLEIKLHSTLASFFNIRKENLKSSNYTETKRKEVILGG
jgi:hypothetical protein